MTGTRSIRENEKALILFILSHLGFTEQHYPINNTVYEYEGGIMGSISLAKDENYEYAGDLLQLEYADIDGVPVIITLTKDTENNLLDLDFWKDDFSQLIKYPTAATVSVKA